MCINFWWEQPIFKTKAKKYENMKIFMYFLIVLTSLTFNELPELCKEIMHALKEKKELNLIIFI